MTDGCTAAHQLACSLCQVIKVHTIRRWHHGLPAAGCHRKQDLGCQSAYWNRFGVSNRQVSTSQPLLHTTQHVGVSARHSFRKQQTHTILWYRGCSAQRDGRRLSSWLSRMQPGQLRLFSWFTLNMLCTAGWIVTVSDRHKKFLVRPC